MVELAANAPAPRIAVVIPCYNDGATLVETLESVRDQEPCEIVVVDDGSHEEPTLALLERIGSDGVDVVRQENGGPGAARMAGVRATTARYVFPLDADDALAPGALSELADALDADPSLSAAWGDERTFGRLSGRVRAADHIDPWLLTHLNELPLAALLRREVLLQTGGWQLRSGYEDWDLWMTLAERGARGRRIPRVIAFYRIHDARRWAANRRQHDAIYGELRRRHPRLFARRRRNWLRSRAPLRLRLVLPLVAAAPLSGYDRYRLGHLVAHPLRLLRARIAR